MIEAKDITVIVPAKNDFEDLSLFLKNIQLQLIKPL